MKNYIKCFLCCILFCCPYFVMAKVTCSNGNYNATIDIDKTELTIADTANITISSEFNYEVEYRIDNDVISINEETGLVTPLKNGSSKVNVVIDFIEEDNGTIECTSILNIDVTSNDSSLKSLTLEELDISAVFNSNTLEYEIKLPYSYEKINIIAEANDPNATITGDGRRYLNDGTNEYEIIVTADNGSTTTYKITILRDEPNEDNTLKNLIVEGYVLSPKFSSDIYEYTLDVDNEVELVTINAEATYNLAKIIGIGEYKLATGSNTFFVTVVAENNTEQKYQITINKSKGNSRLANLVVDGHKLEQAFDSENFIYNLTINNDIDKLNIKAEAIDNDQVEIIGNEDLVVGENNIIIRVSNKDKGATTYKLIVNKLSSLEQEEKEKNSLLLKILLIVFIILIIVMFSFIGIFIKRNYLNSKLIKNKKDNKKKTKK